MKFLNYKKTFLSSVLILSSSLVCAWQPTQGLSGFVQKSQSGTMINQNSLMKSIESCDFDLFNLILNKGGIEINQFAGTVAGVGGTTPLTLLVNTVITSDEVSISKCTQILDVLISKNANPFLAMPSSPDLFSSVAHVLNNSVYFPHIESKKSIKAIAILDYLKNKGIDFSKVSKNKNNGFNELQKPSEDGNLLMKMMLLENSIINLNSAAKNYIKVKETDFKKVNDSIKFFAYVSSNSEVNAQNFNGRTALILAAMQGSSFSSMSPLISLLIEQGADKSIKDKSGKTALDYVLSNGDLEALKLLK